MEAALSKPPDDAGSRELREELATVRQQRVALSTNAERISKESVKLFISYAHEDTRLCENLKKSLKSLIRNGLVSEWTDHDIVPGAPWEEEIFQAMDAAEIILLLISVDFLASDYVFEKELPRAVELYKAGQTKVIPIILRPCDWEDTLVGQMKVQALPKEAKPVVKWDNSDESYLDILRGLKRTIQDLRA